jgi:hypothetical protein
MTRFTSVKIALMAGVLISNAPSAQAGFEFTPASKPAAAEAPAANPNAPMQLVPVTVPPVAQMPLADTMVEAIVEGPDRDKVISKPVSSAVPEVSLEPEIAVYVRRQKNLAPMHAQKAQPMDAEILLRATEPVEDINAALVIDPYPLEEQAVHNADMTTLPVEQAMMEETGTLRPVGVPGSNNKAGMMARANISARHDKGNQYQNTTGKKVSKAINITSMTPIPGGEGEPLKPLADSVEQQVLPPIAPKQIAQPVMQPVAGNALRMPQPAPVIQPAQQAKTTPANTGFVEAVGFGHDLPLALALSQVVPPNYSYAFSPDINVGTNVSWQGGKPWNQVLDEMLAPNGMRAVIENNKITIRSVNS